MAKRENQVHKAKPVTKQYIRSVCGMLKSDTSTTEPLLEERARDKEREEMKFKRFRRSGV